MVGRADMDEMSVERIFPFFYRRLNHHPKNVETGWARVHLSLFSLDGYFHCWPLSSDFFPLRCAKGEYTDVRRVKSAGTKNEKNFTVESSKSE